MALSLMPDDAALANLITIGEVLDWVGSKDTPARTSDPVRLGRPGRTSFLDLIGTTDEVRHIASINPVHWESMLTGWLITL